MKKKTVGRTGKTCVANSTGSSGHSKAAISTRSALELARQSESTMRAKEGVISGRSVTYGASGDV